MTVGARYRGASTEGEGTEKEGRTLARYCINGKGGVRVGDVQMLIPSWTRQ